MHWVPSKGGPIKNKEIIRCCQNVYKKALYIQLDRSINWYKL